MTEFEKLQLAFEEMQGKLKILDKAALEQHYNYVAHKYENDALEERIKELEECTDHLVERKIETAKTVYELCTQVNGLSYTVAQLGTKLTP